MSNNVSNNGKHILDKNVCSTLVVLEYYPASVEFNFEPLVNGECYKPPICHHGDTMCQINIVYRGAHQEVLLEVHGKFQPSRAVCNNRYSNYYTMYIKIHIYVLY